MKAMRNTHCLALAPRARAALIATATLVASCASSRPEPGGTNTNWLMRCESDAACGAGSCECGLCTRTCEADAMCGDLSGTRCVPQRDLPSCGEPETSLCALPCQTNTDCGAINGAQCELGLCVVQEQAPQSTETSQTNDGFWCNPLAERDRQPVTPGELIAVARAANDTLYVVDRDPSVDHRVFVSESGTLMRQTVLGTGESVETLLITFDQDGEETTLAIELVGDRRIALATGEVERGFDAVLAAGEQLERLPSEPPADLPFVNLPTLMTREYGATLDNGASNTEFIVVVRPAADAAYEDFELYYGPETNLQQRVVEEVTRARDGGSTTIRFRVEGESWTASFPIGGPASLVTPAGETALTRLERLVFNERPNYRCLPETTADRAGPPGTFNVFPPGRYGQSCSPGDSTCEADGYECLEVNDDAWGMPSPACFTRCQTVDDCPFVWSNHCGDQTTCIDGVCGFWPCA